MAEEYYNDANTAILIAEDSAFGTPGTYNTRVGYVNSFSDKKTQNIQYFKGVGDGRNYVTAKLGNFSVTGNFEVDVNSDTLSFFQYAIGKKAGSGTVGDPYEIQELDRYGYDATNIKTFSIKKNSEGDSNDDAVAFISCAINSFTLSMVQGQKLTCSFDWTGKTVASTTSLTAYTSPSDPGFVSQEGGLTINAETFQVMAFTLQYANGNQYFNAINDRFIKLPSSGARVYGGNLRFKMKYDSTASTLSPLELRDIFFGQAGSPLTSGDITAYPMSLVISEGAVAGDRVINIDLENVYFDNFSTAVRKEEGVYEGTVDYIAFAGLTDSTVKVPIRWYTVS